MFVQENCSYEFIWRSDKLLSLKMFHCKWSTYLCIHAKKFCELEIHDYYYTTWGYHSNKLPSINAMHDCKLQWVSNYLFQCIMAILWIVIIFWCIHAKCGKLYEGNSSTIDYLCMFLWTVASNVSLDIYHLIPCRTIRDAGDRRGSQYYKVGIKSDTYSWIFSGHYTSSKRNMEYTVIFKRTAI